MSLRVVDGQRQPKLEPLRLELLDDVGLDRRMTSLPLVIEHDSMEPFYEADGLVAHMSAWPDPKNESANRRRP